jgi:hypothetical protein
MMCEPNRARLASDAALLLLQVVGLLVSRGSARTPLAKPARREAADKALLLAVLLQAHSETNGLEPGSDRRWLWRKTTTSAQPRRRHPTSNSAMVLTGPRGRPDRQD